MLSGLNENGAYMRVSMKRVILYYITILIAVQILIILLLIFSISYVPFIKENKILSVILVVITAIFLGIIWPIILGKKVAKLKLGSFKNE